MFDQKTKQALKEIVALESQLSFSAAFDLMHNNKTYGDDAVRLCYELATAYVAAGFSIADIPLCSALNIKQRRTGSRFNQSQLDEIFGPFQGYVSAQSQR
jgi:hypothetical protein